MSGRAINRVLIVPGGAGGTGGNTGTISAGTAAATLGEVVFADSNGVTFGVDGQTVTASVGAAGSVNFSAGTASADLDAVVFSNSNGVSFGLNGSTITATVQTNYLTTAMASNRGSDFVQATAVFNGTNASGTIASNAISVSVGNYLTSQSNQAASASNGSFTFQTLGFSNANNVTFGTSAGSIVTASVAAAGGGATLSTYWGYEMPLGDAAQLRAIDGFVKILPVIIPQQLSASAVNLYFSANQSTSSNSSYAGTFYGGVCLYTLTGETLSAATNASASFAWTNTSNDSTNQLIGIKMMVIPMTVNATPGNYWVGQHFLYSTAGANWITLSQYEASVLNQVPRGYFGSVANTSVGPMVGWGRISNTRTAIPDSVALSDIYQGDSALYRQRPYFYFYNT